MKKAFGIFAAVFALTAFGCKSTKVEQPESSALSVQLEVGADYEWDCEVENEKIVGLGEQTYERIEDSDDGIETFSFICKKEGETKITFSRYPKDEESEEEILVRTAKIIVAKDLSSKIEFDGQN